MHNSTKHSPPHWADKLLERFCDPDLLEEIQGDLQEEFAYQVQTKGKRKAQWNYWLDVLGFIRPFAFKRSRRKHTYHSTPIYSPDMLRNYLKTAFRHLTRHRTSTSINLFGLTLGLTACMVIYLITHFELNYDTFHPDKERIYRLVCKGHFGPHAEDQPFGFLPNAVPAAMRKEISGIETIAAFHNTETDVLIPDGKEEPKRLERRQWGVDKAEIILTEPSYFDIFHYTWLSGNPKTALNEPFKVVLSERKARKYFGDIPLESMIGREVIYHDSVRTTVAGIIKDWDQQTDFTFTDFISLATVNASKLKGNINLEQWDDIWSASQAFVKLPQGTTPAQLEPQFQQFSKAHFQKDLKIIPSLQPLSDLHFNAEYGDNYSRKAHLPTLYGLMGIALFILVIAVINFINMATAQSAQWAKEVGIRKVLGSNRRNLIFQFLMESLLTTLVAIILALLLTKPVLIAFQHFVPDGVTFQLLDSHTLLFLLLLTVTTALLAGFYPSWILSSYLPALTLKGQTALKGGQKGYLRKGLIVFQFTVSLIFIIGTLMVERQLNFMRNKDLGFKSDAVITLTSPRGPRGNNLEVLYNKVQQLSGVKKAILEVLEPMGINYGIDRVVYKGKTEIQLDAAYKMGNEEYIPFYEMKLLAGRSHLKSDTASEFVINATFVKALGFKHPMEAIGKQLVWRDKYYPIVGVVADFHQQSMHEKIAPTFITTSSKARNIAIKLKSKDLQEVKTTIDKIEKAWKQVYPNHKFSYVFLDDAIAEFYEKEQKTSQLVNTATAITILISCVGLLGLVMFTTEQRMKEIGIRKILGASVYTILLLLSRDFLLLIGIALLVASPIAWYATHQWLQDFVYKVDIAWWIFGLAGIASIVITLFTISFQSLKAALMNPTKSLRSE
ncbi:permease prefix domain 2-containing transporter [Xanthocytophaga agilis]|uniref:Permease prefix domain 2-containing transporter n=1 Tax=Xanthocytophaga agilis TaxID=3048010 RepID=A0AAE3QZ32_9BACT|nr:permease prefix domain 2-containing transporter [Xanthocytophaga agilis]MDJ1500691.1 permease prefix domain 2-containing transporter [Xanthocytophaga agilis]